MILISVDHEKGFTIWTQYIRTFENYSQLASEHPQQHEDVRLQHGSQDDDQGGRELRPPGGPGFGGRVLRLIAVIAAE